MLPSTESPQLRLWAAVQDWFAQPVFRPIAASPTEQLVWCEDLKLQARFSATHAALVLTLLLDQPRNKLALWNLAHLNAAPLPMGQFFLTENRDLAFGIRLPLTSHWWGHLPELGFSLLETAFAYRRIIAKDFGELPFQEDEHHPDPLLGLSPRLPAAPEPGPERIIGATMLQATLAQESPASHWMATSATEIAFTGGETPTLLSTQELPLIHATSAASRWALTFSTELGSMPTTPQALWMWLNRQNSIAGLVGFGVTYQNRKPMVLLRTGLPGHFCNRPHLWRPLIDAHQAQAAAALQELSGRMAIESTLNANLG